MKSEITVKLLKNPENFIYKEEVFNYIIMLEKYGKLRELPKNLLVYHVISLFADEVNNGGIEQYLENPSGKTYGELRLCAEYLRHEIITPFLIALCDYIDAGNKTYDAFNSRFYEIEKKYDFRKAALKYYKDNFEVDKIKIPAIKEPESEKCKYFVLSKSEKCVDMEEALQAFLEVLAAFSCLRWKIYIYSYLNGEYNVYGRSFDENIDLEALMADWSENADFKIQRMKLCGYFEEIMVESLKGGMKYGISICKSGFEKDEYKMKHKFLAGGYDTVSAKAFSRITLGKFPRRTPEIYQKIKGFLEENYSEYSNIEGVFEEGFVP